MDHSRERGRNRREFRLEGLEGRELLTAFQPLPNVGQIVRYVKTPGPAVPVTLVQGRITGTQATAGLYRGTNPSYVSYSGHGTANPFGGIVFGTEFLPGTTFPGTNIQPAVLGTARIATAKGGDQIYASFSGVASTVSRNNGALSLQGTIQGGTGRFVNASGVITLFGVVKHQKFNLGLTIRFDTPV
ncbi:MAG: hypothetical protein U0835_03665 [Isosphaeraceae bacterium]